MRAAGRSAVRGALFLGIRLTTISTAQRASSAPCCRPNGSVTVPTCPQFRRHHSEGGPATSVHRPACSLTHLQFSCPVQAAAFGKAEVERWKYLGYTTSTSRTQHRSPLFQPPVPATSLPEELGVVLKTLVNPQLDIGQRWALLLRLERCLQQVWHEALKLSGTLTFVALHL